MISLTVLEKFSQYPGNWWKTTSKHPLGNLEIVGKGDALVGIGFDQQIEGLQRQLAGYEIPENSTVFEWQDSIKFNQALICGTPFQISVWQELITIPAGEVRTYSDIAHAIGSPKAVRAVGTAVGANPVSILIPCHRIVPKRGGIGNYYWGTSIKEKLLEMEKYTL